MPSPMLMTLKAIFYLNVPADLWLSLGKNCYYLHFEEVETEIRKVKPLAHDVASKMVM